MSHVRLSDCPTVVCFMLVESSGRGSSVIRHLSLARKLGQDSAGGGSIGVGVLWMVIVFSLQHSRLTNRSVIHVNGFAFPAAAAADF